MHWNLASAAVAQRNYQEIIDFIKDFCQLPAEFFQGEPIDPAAEDAVLHAGAIAFQQFGDAT